MAFKVASLVCVISGIFSIVSWFRFWRGLRNGPKVTVYYDGLKIGDSKMIDNEQAWLRWSDVAWTFFLIGGKEIKVSTTRLPGDRFYVDVDLFNKILDQHILTVRSKARGGR